MNHQDHKVIKLSAKPKPSPPGPCRVHPSSSCTKETKYPNDCQPVRCVFAFFLVLIVIDRNMQLGHPRHTSSSREPSCEITLVPDSRICVWCAEWRVSLLPFPVVYASRITPTASCKANKIFHPWGKKKKDCLRRARCLGGKWCQSWPLPAGSQKLSYPILFSVVDVQINTKQDPVPCK